MLVFFGRLSPSRTPSPQPSPVQEEGVALLFFGPLGQAEPRVQTKRGPVRGTRGISCARRRDTDGPSADPLRRQGVQGTRAFCGRWRRRSWLWELWPKPKFLVCRDETRLIYIAGRRHPQCGTDARPPPARLTHGPIGIAQRITAWWLWR